MHAISLQHVAKEHNQKLRGSSTRCLRPRRSRRRPSPPTPRPHLDSGVRSPSRTLTRHSGPEPRTCLPRFRPSTSPKLKPIETPKPRSPPPPCPPQFKVAAPHNEYGEEREKPHPKNRGKKTLLSPSQLKNFPSTTAPNLGFPAPRPAPPGPLPPRDS